jgi:hypothetical protein
MPRRPYQEFLFTQTLLVARLRQLRSEYPDPTVLTRTLRPPSEALAAAAAAADDHHPAVPTVSAETACEDSSARGAPQQGDSQSRAPAPERDAEPQGPSLPADTSAPAQGNSAPLGGQAQHAGAPEPEPEPEPEPQPPPPPPATSPALEGVEADSQAGPAPTRRQPSSPAGGGGAEEDTALRQALGRVASLSSELEGLQKVRGPVSPAVVSPRRFSGAQTSPRVD